MPRNRTITMQTVENATPRLLRRPDVERLTGLRRSSVYRLARLGEFPKPLKIGPRSSAWDAAAVQRWIDDRIAVGGAK